MAKSQFYWIFNVVAKSNFQNSLSANIMSIKSFTKCDQMAKTLSLLGDFSWNPRKPAGDTHVFNEF